MKNTIILLITLVVSLTTSFAYAAPPEHFHEGPYLQMTFGLLETDYDLNQRTGVKAGDDYEPSFGMLFGWNLTDNWAAQLGIRYATDSNAGNREHFVSTDMKAKYSFLFDSLLDFDTLRILPFLQTGVVFHTAGIPGDPLSTDNTVLVWGAGPTVGLGVNFMISQYIYAGIEFNYDFPRMSAKNQVLAGVNTQIYSGGFKPQLNGQISLGFHF